MAVAKQALDLFEVSEREDPADAPAVEGEDPLRGSVGRPMLVSRLASVRLASFQHLDVGTGEGVVVDGVDLAADCTHDPTVWGFAACVLNLHVVVGQNRVDLEGMTWLVRAHGLGFPVAMRTEGGRGLICGCEDLLVTAVDILRRRAVLADWHNDPPAGAELLLAPGLGELERSLRAEREHLGAFAIGPSERVVKGDLFQHWLKYQIWV